MSFGMHDAAVTVQLLVSPEGRVTEITTSSETEGLADCTERVFRALRFPKPEGGGIVRARFQLRYRASAER